MENLRISREIWREELALRELVWVFNSPIMWSMDSRSMKFKREAKEIEKMQNAVDQIIWRISSNNIPQIKKLLSNKIKSLSNGRKGTKALFDFINQISEKNQKELSKIPNSIEKAEGYLLAYIDQSDFFESDFFEAVVIMRNFIDAEMIKEIVQKWKDDLKYTIARQNEPTYVHSLEGKRRKKIIKKLPSKLLSYRFWTSRDFMDSFDDLSRYRFMEEFNIGEFPKTINQIENSFMQEMDALNLWLVSRSRKLSAKIRRNIDVSLFQILEKKDPTEPYWTNSIYDKQKSEFYPSYYETAISSLIILKLSRSFQQRQIAKDAIEWLIQNQSSKGYWTYPESNQKNIKESSDLITTFYALQALKESGLVGIDNSIELAEDWILSNQDELGYWKSEHSEHSTFYLTSLIIEEFRKKNTPINTLNGYIKFSIEIYSRSLDLLYDDDINSKRIAIMLTFQALESFLYGLLMHQDLNIKIFSSANETIGLVKALNQFQTYLQFKRIIKSDQVLEYRNDIDSIKYYRDQIVHKAAMIIPDNLESLIFNAGSFIKLNFKRVYNGEISF